MNRDSRTDSGGLLLHPDWPDPRPGVRAAVSTRLGGPEGSPFGLNTSYRLGDDEDRVRESRRRFLAAAGAREDRLATAGQVHGATVVLADRPGHHPACDALVTARRDLWLGVTIADCLPILLRDDETPAVGIVHSGWRGSRERIVESALRRMVEEFGSRPERIQAWIGPGAGSCCYEVGEEVARGFPPEHLIPEGGRWKLDLPGYNRNLLVRLGVPIGRIGVSGRCTIHERELFHSHRRDGLRSGRMLAILGIIE